MIREFFQSSFRNLFKTDNLIVLVLILLSVSPSIINYLSWGFTLMALPYFLFQMSLIYLIIANFNKPFLPTLILHLLSFPVTCIAWIHYSLFRYPPTEGTYGSILHTNGSEALEFMTSLNWPLYILFFVLLIMPLVILLKIRPRNRLSNKNLNKVLLIFCLLVTGVKILKNGSRLTNFKETFTWSHPLNSYLTIYQANELKMAYSNQIKSRRNMALPNLSASETRNIDTIVLVLGETARRANWQIHGHTLPTNPRLSQKELVIFNSALTSSNQTIVSLENIIGNAYKNPTKDLSQNISIIQLAKVLGYKTYWLSNQAKIGEHDSGSSFWCYDADICKFTNNSSYNTSHDEKLLPLLSQALADRESKKFIILHQIGSHGEYHQRSPANFKLFNQNKKIPGTVLEEYNNSLLYTDYILAEVINALDADARSAIMIYLSDHGENLMDDDRQLIGHAGPQSTRYEAEIPFFLWTSQLFSESNQDLLRSIKLNHKKTISTVDFYTSFQQLLGLKLSPQEQQECFFCSDFKSRSKNPVLNSDRHLFYYEDLL
jgi:glucan phosphoethanolaminetransferase (alkaline phosphatase superfamily)